jgi:serine/threonine protein kinase/Flp pilus assembly protein TadD
MNSDRNLLFGILALQLDFISRDALIAAMHAWVLAKHCPIGEILVEQGVLSTDDRDALETIVEKHLHKHCGDVERSLAAQSAPDSLQQSLRQIADADLHASLARLPTPAEVPLGTTGPPALGSLSAEGLRYQILRPHARGGLGEVFVAHDCELNRQVALKEIREDHAADTNSCARFVLEGEITGGLEHPGIVPIYGLGRYADGRPFYAMRFVKGNSLKDAIERFHTADQCRRNPGASSLELRKLLSRFIAVCDAIAYAHSRGVLHRDIKPANIMLGDYGETLVVDWGLAKAVGSEQGAVGREERNETALRPASAQDVAATLPGSALGTPAYMSPEQAVGRGDLLGPASDIYSLGATLYCLLTGQAPFGDKDRDEVLKKVQHGEFVLPRQANHQVPPALEAICLKTMALRPENRYASAKALAADIEHWLADEPVTAYRGPLPARARRWARHHKPLVASVAALVLTALLLGSGWAWWYQRDQAAREAARLQRQADTKRDVTAALARADTFLQESWKQTDYPERWQVTLGLAESAVQSAEGLLAAGESTEELTEPVQAMRAAVDEAARDSRLRGEIDRIRLEMTLRGGKSYDFAKGAKQYGAALRAHGIDESKPEQAARRIRSSHLRKVLLAAVEDWERCSSDLAERQQLQQMLRAAAPDPDDFRSRWQTARERRDTAALNQLAQEVLSTQPPASILVNLSRDLRLENRATADELAVAHQLLRAGQERYPNDFWLNHDLGLVLRQLNPPRHEEAVRFLTVALALRSDSAWAHSNLGLALYDKKDFEAAIHHFRAAIALDQKFAPLHHNLGMALLKNEDIEEAIRSFRTAISLDVNYAEAHCDLGTALKSQGNLEAAIRCYDTAIKLDPTDARFYNNLGNALGKKDLEGAIRCFQTAIKLDPKSADAYSNMGIIFKGKGDLQEAIRCYRAAITINPKYAQAHFNLGNALRAQGNLEGAIREYQAAVEIDSNCAEAYFNLGRTLQDTGRFSEALRALRTAQDLGSKRKDWRVSTTPFIRLVESMVELEAKLSKILKGEAKPADIGERLRLAWMCQQQKKLYLAAYQFYSDAFFAEPARAEDLRIQHRYNAACAAALAGCGQGEDAAKLDDQERARLRRQALTWLRADLVAWNQALEKQADQVRPAVQKTMQHWQQDADFAGVRGDALAKLLEAERQEWRKLWDDVEALRKRAVDGK